MRSLCALPLLLLFHTAAAQTLTAMDAYAGATEYRERADSLWRREAPERANLLKALTILDEGLRYLDRPDVRDLAQGSKTLKYRRFNILNDKAHIFGLLNEKDSTLSTLQAMSAIGGNYYASIEEDSSFAFIRREEGYKKMIAAMRQSEALWNAPALKTPYRDDLPLNEKLAGLSLLWSQAKYNFVHFDNSGIDWNKHYLGYIDRVTATKSTADYYKVLIEFYAALKDGHTNVYFPKELQDQFYTRPPFRTELLEGRVFVTEVYSDTLKQMGIEKGLEVLAIDGEPVLHYAEKNVEPYQSSSTPQDMEVRKFTYGLFAGSKDVPLQVQFRNKSGKEWVQAVPRSGYSNVTAAPVFGFREIGDIGYLELNSFGDPKVRKMYDSVFTRIAKTKALIIDLRRNGGGSGDIGFHILSTLTDAPFALPAARIAQYSSTYGGEAQWYVYPPEQKYPSKKMQYAKPVVLLVGPRTFSAAEDFTVAFSYMKRGKILGQPTGGSTGQPLLFDLPGGGTARVCAKYDSFPDGKKFVGTGIAPDILVPRKISDLQRDHDATLAKALELLK